MVQITYHEQDNRYHIWTLGSDKNKKPEYRRKMIGCIDGDITPEEFCEYFEQTKYPFEKAKEQIYYVVVQEWEIFPMKKIFSYGEAKEFAQNITTKTQKETFVVQVQKKYEFNQKWRFLEETQFLKNV